MMIFRVVGSRFVRWLTLMAMGLPALGRLPVQAEGPLVRYGDPVPRDVREIYEAGIRYLLSTQDESGSWKDGQAGPGVTGMAVMVLLASGEDPNFGPYRRPIRKALRSMILEQDPDTGFLGSSRGHDSMYQHGFGMLALAEAYGVVDDRALLPPVGATQLQVEARVGPVPPAAVPAVPLQPPRQVEAAAVEAAQRDARILGWVLERGLEALAAPVANGPPAVVLDRQRRLQIDQQAQQMERFFQPVLASELELIRQACGSLEPDARRKLLAAGRAAVKTTAKEFATRQLTGGLGQDGFDPRAEIRRPLTTLLETLALPREFAAYEAEQIAREARRAEAARVIIVTKLDRQLDLTSDQRRAIEADLERQWQADWLRSLGEHHGLINGYPAAPDYAAVCIAPHLRPDQVTAWSDWCQAAGERLIGRHHGINLDNQGIQTIDAWWPGAER